jgi:hypothetical protein
LVFVGEEQSLWKEWLRIFAPEKEEIIGNREKYTRSFTICIYHVMLLV